MSCDALECCILFENFGRFVPDLEDIVSFEELTSEAKLGDETTDAAKFVFPDYCLLRIKYITNFYSTFPM